MRILCFLEDRAHEAFVCTLIRRIAREESVDVRLEVRSARHGARVFSELKRFLMLLKKSGEPLLPGQDVLLVVADADRDRKKRVDQLRKAVGQELLDVAVFCIPDPHIEKWYVLDERALEDAAGVRLGGMPGSRQRDYKLVLKRTVEETGSILGGVEYGGDLAESMNLKLAESRDANFKEFLKSLRSQLRRAARGV